MQCSACFAGLLGVLKGGRRLQVGVVAVFGMFCLLAWRAEGRPGLAYWRACGLAMYMHVCVGVSFCLLAC